MERVERVERARESGTAAPRRYSAPRPHIQPCQNPPALVPWKRTARGVKNRMGHRNTAPALVSERHSKSIPVIAGGLQHISVSGVMIDFHHNGWRTLLGDTG